jgi:cellulose synthase/poly-beta-1,6-N-acetylglucosamine synthase-like glycosyltransferase
MERPFVSICVPAFNAERTIVTTLRSLVNQTYPHFEIHVVDDSSTDRTVDVVRSFGEAVMIHRNATNLGLRGNWQRCMHLGRGRYRALSSDWRDRLSRSVFRPSTATPCSLRLRGRRRHGARALAHERLNGRKRSCIQPVIVPMKLTVYMDPYGRFFLSEQRGAYPVEVEFSDGYYVADDAGGKRVLVGPEKSWTEATEPLRLGLARIV